jgi:hypothetical protein
VEILQDIRNEPNFQVGNKLFLFLVEGDKAVRVPVGPLTPSLVVALTIPYHTLPYNRQSFSFVSSVIVV